jgi:acetate kinase
MKVAVINSGSSSIKYEVFDAGDFSMLASGLIEKIGGADGRLKQRRLRADGAFDEQIHTKPLANHREAFDLMASVNQHDRIIKDDAELLGIGHRVVHGGETFHEPVLVNADVIEAIRGLIPLAPLHNPSNLLGIEAAQERFVGVPQVAVFDTAFHHTLPPAAYRYAVPHELYEQHHVRKYGFHGSSHGYVAKEAARHLGKPLSEVNLIILHLGNGASAAAIQGGRSIDTSMGMTPLEGLVMGTRCGDIDPASVIFLVEKEKTTPQEIDKVLNYKSGLKGISGISNDVREIKKAASEGHRRARLALDIFAYRIRKYIGSYIAAMGGADAIIFTAGIGENETSTRQAIVKGLGSVLTRCKTKVLVVATNEELMIARQTFRLVR